MNNLELFGGLRLTTWFKYLAYLGGILLIASLFTSPSLVATIQSFAIWTIIIAIIAWMAEQISELFFEYYKAEQDDGGVIATIYFYECVIILLLFFWVMLVALPFIHA